MHNTISDNCLKNEIKKTGDDFSIILPVFNEEIYLETMLQRIHDALSPLNKSYEIVCIDDGSSDRTWEIIVKASQSNKSVKGIKFLRNFGHQIAVYAGIEQSFGKYLAILDADGQDPPEILPKLFEKCMSGYDVVYAVRKKRKENIFKRLAYKLFYRIYQMIVPFSVPLDSGDFGVFNRSVADFIKSLPEKTPFIRGLRSWYGGRQIGVEYERQARTKGKSKYSFIKLLYLAMNGSMSFSKVPLRVFSIIGTLTSIVCAIYGFILLIIKITVGIGFPLGWTTITLLIIFFGGLNLLALGVIGEYIGNIFDEVKNRPRYLMKETVGF